MQHCSAQNYSITQLFLTFESYFNWNILGVCDKQEYSAPPAVRIGRHLKPETAGVNDALNCNHGAKSLRHGV